MTARTGKVFGLAVAAAVLATGCSLGDDFGEEALEIDRPSPGAVVSPPFTLHFDASVDVGTEGTSPFIRVFIDGIRAGDARGQSFTVEQVEPGKHRVHASLLDVDGSPIGAEDEVTVKVAAG